MRSFFSRLKQGLNKTKERLAFGVREVVANYEAPEDELFEEIEEILIAADCGVETSALLVERLRERTATEQVERSQQVLTLLKDEMSVLLRDAGKTADVRTGNKGDDANGQGRSGQPLVTMFVGVNGTGKTTSIGKIAAHLAQDDCRVMLAGCDTFRAAATEQLDVWAKRAGADLVRGDDNADPAAVAYSAVEAATARGRNHVLVDTAGRLHTKYNLMAELEKIGRSIDKALPDGAPSRRTWLVLDATTGQNGLAQAAAFKDAVGLDGVVLTKLDGTARGGIVLAIVERLRAPVVWVGVGETVDDLETFDPDEFIEALFA